MMDISVTQVISTLMGVGIMVSINQRLDAETINMVAEEFGFKTEYVSAEVQEAVSEEEDDENEWVELELEDDAEDDLIEFDGAEEADIPVRWQLDITYRNGTSQQVISRAFLPDRVEELVWQLMEYLFPEDEDEPEE